MNSTDEITLRDENRNSNQNQNQFDAWQDIKIISSNEREFLSLFKGKDFNLLTTNEINSISQKIPLITAACKYDLIEVVDYLWKNSSKFQKNILKEITKDLDKHNMFYYAIRSNNIDLFKLVVDFWAKTNENQNTKQNLIGLISIAYEELKLLNVGLLDIMELYVQESLKGIRVFYGKGEESNIKSTEIRKHIKMLAEISTTLIDEYSSKNRILDNKFYYLCTIIAQNLHILKKQLKITYDKLPWEEMEFCLSAFVSLQNECQHINWIYSAVLDRNKLLNYLNEFHITLSKIVIKDEDIGNMHNMSQRELLIENVIKHNAKFKPLFEDFRQIKNAYSLNRIRYYINLALSETSEKSFDFLVIKRAIQVTGEYLKNTIESPNLSSDISNKLFKSFRSDVSKIIKKLRDNLSHFHIIDDYTVRCEQDILNDLKKVKRTIDAIFYYIQNEMIHEILKKILECKNIEQARELSNLFNNFELNEDYPVAYIKEIDNIQKNIAELKKEIKQPTKEMQKIFGEFDDAIQIETNQQHEIKKNCTTKIEYLRLIIYTISKEQNIEMLHSFAKIGLGLSNQELSNRFDQMSLLVDKFGDTIENEGNNKTVSLLYQTKAMAYFKQNNIETIEKFKKRLKKNVNNKEIEDSIFAIIMVIDRKLDDEDDKVSKTIEAYTELEYFLNKLKKRRSVIEFSRYKSLLKTLRAKPALEIKLDDYFKSSQWNELHKELQIYLKKYCEFKKAIKTFLEDGKFETTLECIKKLCENFNEASKNKLEVVLKEILENENKKLKNHYVETLKLLKKALEFETFEKFENIEKLIAAYETLLLDAFTYVGERLNCLNLHVYGTYFCVQKYMPLLTGKQIRNYLAHGGALIDILSPLPFVAIIVNCLELITESSEMFDGNNKNKLYFTVDQPAHEIEFLKQKYDMNVNLIQNQMEMFAAIEENDLSKIKYYISQGADINARDINNNNILHNAAKNDKLDIFKIVSILNKNLINDDDMEGAKPFHIAAREGSLKILTMCLENSIVDVSKYLDCKKFTLFDYVILNKQVDAFELLFKNCNNDENLEQFLLKKCNHKNKEETVSSQIETLKIHNYPRLASLHTAVRMQHKQMVIHLIEMGANVNEQGGINNFTPLHIAAQYNCTDIIECLLKIPNINVNAKDSNGFTPLHLAIYTFSEEAVKCLIRADNIDIKCSLYMLTPLYLAIASAQKKIVEILLNGKGVDINCTTIENKTPLHIASEYGHKDIVEILLKKKAAVNCKIMKGFTPLHLASHNGHKDVVELLIKHKGVDINCTAVENDTPLHLASLNGHKDVVEVLIKQKGVDINCTTIENNTPLHFASEYGHKDIVEILLKKKVGVNCKSEKGFTPLHLASQNGHKDVVELLIKHKDVDINCTSLENCTPLHLASHNGHKDIVEILLKKKADVNCKTEKAVTPLHIASLNGHTDVVELLIKQKGVDINCTRIKNYTPLHLASYSGQKDIVEILLKQQADANCKSTEGVTPLYFASENGHKDIVEILIKHQADANCKITDGRTLLHSASENGHKDIVEILLKHLADANCKSTEGITPLHFASENGHKDIVELLIKQKDVDINCKTIEKFTPLHFASQNGHKHVVGLLIKRKDVDINCTSIKNYTPLHFASQNGHKDIVEILLKRQADANCKSTEGRTPLHFASDNGHTDIVEILLKKKAGVNCKSEKGVTPLHFASVKGHKDVVELLIKHKDVDINCTSMGNCTPLHLASLGGRKDIVEILLKHQADANCKSTEGRTPLHSASEYGHKDIVELLIKQKDVEINCKTIAKVTPLHFASQNGHKDVVELLIKQKNVDINCTTIDHRTPLNLAVDNGRKDVVKVLMKKIGL